MPVVERSALVAYSAEQMYRLVDDIEAYPEFLPWCAAASESDRHEQSVIGEVSISKGMFQHSFQTKNTLIPYERIDLQLLSGPFSRLSGHWSFQVLNKAACKISLCLDFEFKSRAADLAFKRIMTDIMVSQVDAFTKRAKQIYGSESYG